MGNRYLISYDLRGKERDYKPIHSKLKGLGARKILESLWHVDRPGETAELVGKSIRQVMDRDDGLLVICLGRSNLTSDWHGWKLHRGHGLQHAK